MLEKLTDRISKTFSKKTVENTKQAIINDVNENKTSYIMAGITGLVIATGVIVAVKAIIGAVPTAPQPLYSITYNYYISMTPETAKAIAAGSVKELA